jgi:hypothetical protein
MPLPAPTCGQMLWTGGAADSIGGTGLGPLVTKGASCATTMRTLCAADSPSQKRAMGYGMSGQPHTRSADLLQVRPKLLVLHPLRRDL